MITQKVIDAILTVSAIENKNKIINALLQHFSNTGDYNESKRCHIIEMLTDDNAFVKPEEIDIKYVKDNIKEFIYNAEKYIIKDIELSFIDNIECYIVFKYTYKDKVNEFRDDVDFSSNVFTIDFTYHPKVLKKS